MKDDPTSIRRKLRELEKIRELAAKFAMDTTDNEAYELLVAALSAYEESNAYYRGEKK